MFCKPIHLISSSFIIARRGLVFFGLLAFTNLACALSDDALFQHARDAYASRNIPLLTDDTNQLQAQKYVLAPYADYWLMLLKLEQARDEEIQNYIAQYVDTPFADRVRGEWLKKLARQKNWGPFFDEYAHFKRDDVSVYCYALLGHIQLADANVTEKVRTLWLTAEDLPSNCNQLFDAMQSTGDLATEDIWLRLRMVLMEGKIGVAKSIALRLPNFDDAEIKLIDKINTNPELLFESKLSHSPPSKKSKGKPLSDKITLSFKTRAGNELALFAIDRFAKTNLEEAIESYKKAQYWFDENNRAIGWGRIALQAARKHHPEALNFYALAEKSAMDKEQLAWQVRAAIRVMNWPAVLKAIAVLQPSQLQEGVWRYWKARALKEQGKESEANAIFFKLSRERHYYGWLAADELESMLGSPDENYTVTENEVDTIASLPAIKRVLELQRLDMRWEAKSEWVWVTRYFDDKQLIAAAEYAMRQKWYDIGISTADNTKKIHDFNLRFPTPYRDFMRASSKAEGVDEAWVYGLTRQESRFMHYAKSGVGASGLMQLMPATAKWVAKRLGLDSFNPSMVHVVSTNIELGTHYMRHTLDIFGGQAVMATAAYNAGPSRAKRWMANEPLEGAIYMETIPFVETRNYVQKVMANAHFYAPRLGTPMQTLKSRLGVIPAKGSSQVVATETDKL